MSEHQKFKYKTKLYALTGDVSEQAVLSISEKAPYFECVFDIMSYENINRILQDIEVVSATEYYPSGSGLLSLNQFMTQWEKQSVLEFTGKN